MPRQQDSIIWQHTTIPQPVARAVTKFLYEAEYPPAYPDPAVGEKWERLKHAYFSMPDDVRTGLPDLPWPAYYDAKTLARARNVVLLYRHATPAERAPLVEALMIEPRPDIELFGIAESRTLDLGAPAVPLGPPPPKSETRHKPPQTKAKPAPTKAAKAKRK